MALSLSTTRRLDGPGDLEALVRAVAAASPDEPETDALEWKGGLDLDARKPRYDLSRHVLGFGNRSVRLARASFEGYAYLLAGVTAGEIIGVDIPDPAELGNALASFVAPGQPAWKLHRVEVEDRTIAVIEVEAPADGDRICTLQDSSFDGRAGRVFVRRHGQTEEASPAEIRMLEDRHAATAIEAARRANELHERQALAAEERVALDRARDARDLEDRAERERPNFVMSRRQSLFSYVSPETVKGMVRNAGGTAATITDLRLHIPGAAVPGSAVPVYGPGVTGDFTPPARIEQGGEGMLRFVNGALQGLSNHQGTLTVEIWFSSDAGLHWLQKLTLRLRGTDHASGRRQWAVRDHETETSRAG
jgi:hypothetical protein